MTRGKTMRWTAAAGICLAALFSVSASAQSKKPRARELGVPFEGTPGALNAITDVAGIEVGHRTLIAGEGKLKVGVGPVRDRRHSNFSAR